MSAYFRILQRVPSSGMVFPELDTLRGLAVLLVFLCHNSYLEEPHDALWYPWVRAGHVGVDLFFVLSGFLLYIQFAQTRGRDGSFDRREFYLRRVLRIAPLYYVSMALLLAVSWPSDFGAIDLMSNLLTLNNVFPDTNRINPPYWSLSTEIHFYVVFPFLAAALARSWRWGALLIGGVLVYRCGVYAVAQWVLAPTRVQAMPWMTSLTVARLDGFLWGMLAARLHLARPDLLRRGAAAGAALLGGLVGLDLLARALAAVGGNRVIYGYVLHPVVIPFHSAVAVCWAAVLLALVALARRPVGGRLLHFSPLRLIGVVSFSIYVFHWPVLRAAHSLLEAVAPQLSVYPGYGGEPVPADFLALRFLYLPVIIFGVVTMLSLLSYLIVEKPFLGGRLQRIVLKAGRRPAPARDG